MPHFAIEDLENIHALAKIDTETLYRTYNGLISLAVLYQYMTDPKAEAKEYLPDATLHALEALMPNRWTLFALGANGLRVAQAGWAAVTGVSSIAWHANVIDVGNHLLMLYHRKHVSQAEHPVNPHQISAPKIKPE